MPAPNRRDPVRPCFGTGNPPIPVVVHRSSTDAPLTAGAARGAWRAGPARKTIDVDEQPARTASSAAASARSIDKRYFSRTPKTRPANQHRFSLGIQPAASRSLFATRFSSGDARVLFSISLANCRFVAAAAAHNPLSCALDRATICSISVSVRRANLRPE